MGLTWHNKKHDGQYSFFWKTPLSNCSLIAFCKHVMWVTHWQHWVRPMISALMKMTLSHIGHVFKIDMLRWLPLFLGTHLVIHVWCVLNACNSGRNPYCYNHSRIYGQYVHEGNRHTVFLGYNFHHAHKKLDDEKSIAEEHISRGCTLACINMKGMILFRVIGIGCPWN